LQQLPQQQQQQQQTPLQETNYIDLMCNWSTGSGTYSPFGAVSVPEQLPEVPQPKQQQQSPPVEKVVPKKRMVAEVRILFKKMYIFINVASKDRYKQK